MRERQDQEVSPQKRMDALHAQMQKEAEIKLMEVVKNTSRVVYSSNHTIYDSTKHPAEAIMALAMGACRSELPFEMGIAPVTLWRWVKDHEEFRQAIEQGEALAEGFWTGVGRRNIMNKNFNTALWMNFMANRFAWSKKVENTQNVKHEITGEVTHAHEHTVRKPEQKAGALEILIEAGVIDGTSPKESDTITVPNADLE